MKNRTDHHLISPTAKLVAYARTKSDIPYSKEISDAVDAEAVSFELFGDHLSEMLYYVSTTTETRYKAIDREIKKTGLKNILELAAGVLPRGLIMTEDPSVKYVATDLPEMIKESESVILGILKEKSENRSNLYFKEVNVLNLDQLLNAIKPFGNEPFVVSCEGLVPYLSKDEQKILAENIFKILSKNGGVWITSDIVDKKNRQNTILAFGKGFADIFKTGMSKIVESTNSDTTENSFENQADAEKFFKGFGFKIDKSPFYDDSYAFSSLKIISDEKVREDVKDSFRNKYIWTMNVK